MVPPPATYFYRSIAGRSVVFNSSPKTRMSPRDAQRVRLSVIDTAGGVGSSKQLSFEEEKSRRSLRVRRHEPLGYNGAEKEVVCLSEGGELVGAKKGCEIVPCSAICCRRPLRPRHGNWPRPRDARSVGSRNGASDSRKVIPLIPPCGVLVRGPIVPPTSAGITGSSSGLSRCVLLRQRT
jgi:hypothetical protein